MDTADVDTAEEAWRQHRRYLFAVAYRILGSITDAEDAVQETYLRAQTHWPDTVQDSRAWLSTVTSRICLDFLKSARSRRESYVGPWLPEPLVNYDDTDLGDTVALRESAGTAMLLVLERLSPAERVAFVLHDVFGMDYDRLSSIVSRAPAACRQLVSRARRTVRAESPKRVVTEAEHNRVVSALHAASGTGDLQALVALLDPDIVLRSDGGGVVPAARRVVEGVDEVARLLLGLGRLYPHMEIRPAKVGSAAGFLLLDGDSIAGAVSLDVSDGRVTAVNLVLNPQKLSQL